MENLSNVLRKIARKRAVVTFLGTGPSDPIKGRGKNRRDNTSTLIEYMGKRYLIDTPPTLDPDIRFDYLMLSHMHRDAYGGFREIEERRFVFGLPAALSREIADDHPWERQILRMNEKNEFGDLKVTPFKVMHDIAYGYPTYGYQIEVGEKKFTYASDMVGVPKNAEKYFNKIDMAVVDGAGWKSNLATHFGVFPFLELVEKKKWKIGRIYFTQIGRPVPSHVEANKEIAEKNPDAELAYDGMTVEI